MEAQGKAAQPLVGRRILIAEDETLIALQLESILQSLGCEIVGPVTRVDDVRKAVEARGFDGALLDVNLRGQQIFSVLAQILALDVPVVITSGYGDATLFPPQFRSLPRVVKPFDEVALRRLCLTMFAGR